MRPSVTREATSKAGLVATLDDICGEAERVTWENGPVFGAINTWKWARGVKHASHSMVELVARIGSEVDQPSGLGDRG